jgi:GMP synthase (glutamine-hydrolysing) A subunit
VPDRQPHAVHLPPSHPPPPALLPSSAAQPDIWAHVKATGLPVLGICYGFQEMAHALGGRVERAPEREFGHAEVAAVPLAEGAPAHAGALLAGLPAPSFKVWMSHGDKITALPPGFAPVGTTPNCEFAAVAGSLGPAPLFGVQFHPEVSHTPQGTALLGNFVTGVCGAVPDWSMASFLDGACAVGGCGVGVLGGVCHRRDDTSGGTAPHFARCCLSII